MRRAAVPLLVVVLAACGSAVETSGEGTSTTSTTSTTTTSTTTTTTPSSGTAVTARADDGIVEVELTVLDEVPAGERLWAELTVRNVGDRVVHWQAGGSSPPGGAHLVDPRRPSAEPPTPRWSGHPDELEEALAGSSPKPIPFREEGTVGLRRVARTSDSRMEPLAPGEEHVMRVAADVGLPPGATTDLVARGSFSGYDEPDHYGGPEAVGPRPPVVAEVPVRVVGLPADARAAVDVFAGDPGLAAFVEATDVSTVDQHWYVELAWWRGAWELVVDPEYGDEPRGQSRYRLRVDPDRGRVVDARRIWWDQSPADDPGGTRFPGAPPDDVEDR